jgi:hypothetical protein
LRIGEARDGPNRAQSTMSDFVTLQPVEHHNEGFFDV